MSAGIVGQYRGRRAPSQTLSSQPMAYTGGRPQGQRVMLIVTPTVTSYFKIETAGATGVTVAAGNCDDTMIANVAYYMPIDFGMEPIITGTVSAVEVLGSFE